MSLVSILLTFLALTWLTLLRAVLVHQGKRFGSTIYDNPKLVSSRELYLASRTSFETEDLLEEILQGAQKKSRSAKVTGARLTYTFAAGAVIASFALPGLDGVDTSVKNLLGLGALFAPFGSLLLQQYGSEILQPPSNGVQEQERICYHEAGHFIVAYLSGLGIDEYRIDGEYDSGLSIDTQNVVMGNALMCAMAGTVAEFLRFGDCTGGEVDIGIALDALRQSDVKRKDEINAYLRFGTLKALALLRLYRDALDDIAVKMAEDASVFELVRVIENCQVE